MLTQSEKQWLERRKLYANVNRWSHFSCQWCEHLDVNREGFRTPCGASIYGCPHVEMEDMRSNVEDIEFSERVAVKLAITGDAWDFEDMPCRGDERQYIRINCKLRKNHWDCADCFLKAARLKVEEEMNAEMDK